MTDIETSGIELLIATKTKTWKLSAINWQSTPANADYYHHHYRHHHRRRHHHNNYIKLDGKPSMRTPPLQLSWPYSIWSGHHLDICFELIGYSIQFIIVPKCIEIANLILKIRYKHDSLCFRPHARCVWQYVSSA